MYCEFKWGGRLSVQLVKDALAAQYPDGSVYYSHGHGSACYIRRR